MKWMIFTLAMIPGVLFAQSYSEVDEFAQSVKYNQDYKKTATTLAAPYTKQTQKARAIFSWIAYHFKYDDRQYEQYQKDSGDRITYSTQEELERKQQERIEKKIEAAMRKKRGVCQDLTWLYQAMLKEVGIKSEFVTGYSRNNPAQMGRVPKDARHAWNAIQIDGQWGLCDLTWSISMFEPRGDDFFLMLPEDFLKSHYPEEEKWQLVDTSISLEQWSNRLYYHKSYATYKITSIKVDGQAYDYMTVPYNSIFEIVLADNSPEVYALKPKAKKQIKLDFDGNTHHLNFEDHKLRGQVKIGVRKGDLIETLLEFKVE